MFPAWLRKHLLTKYQGYPGKQANLTGTIGKFYGTCEVLGREGQVVHQGYSPRPRIDVEH
eukprot:6196796-Pleurochrysis_carterae.AAC.5